MKLLNHFRLLSPMVMTVSVVSFSFRAPRSILTTRRAALSTGTTTSSRTNVNGWLYRAWTQQTQRSATTKDVVFPDPPLPNFCANCGSSNMVIRIPDGDERPRACCADCQAIVYVNPKVVVSTVVLSRQQHSCLLAKRAIEPRRGYWGIPQGFMELGETSRQAAVREVYEETGAVIDPQILQLRAVYNVPGSVQLVYQASVDDEATLEIAASTAESTEVGFFHVNYLPDLCFPTVQWAIDYCSTTTTTTTTSTTSSSTSVGVRVQQKTKFYDKATDTWSEFEDEVQCE